MVPLKDSQADLSALADTLSGTYPERFRALLDHAFRQHAQVLNARQLRDLARGGSQSTAQTAIDVWRKDLHSKLSFRLDVGGDVPPAFTEQIERIVPDLWTFTRTLAAQGFDAERASFERKLNTLAVEFDLRGQELSKVIDQLGIANDQLARTTFDHKALVESSKAMESRLATQAANFETLASERAEQIQFLQSSLTCMQDDHTAQLRTLTKESGDRLAAEIERQQHVVNSLQAEKRELQQARDKAVKESTEAEIARARTERDAAFARSQLEKSTNEVLRLQLAGTQSSSEHSAELLRLQEQLAEAKALAVDMAPITKWVLDGMPTKMPAMAPACIALAQVLSSQAKHSVKKTLKKVE